MSDREPPGVTSTQEGDPAPAAPWWVGWCITRTLVLAVAYLATDVVGGDPAYYLTSLAHAARSGFADVLPEYPLPLVLALWPLRVVVGLGISPQAAVAAALLAVDLGFCRLLLRRCPPPVLRLWIWGVLLAGPLTYQRLDLVPGVLLAASLVATRATSTGGLLALGTAAKLFPVTVVPVALAGSRSPWRVGLATGTVGLALTAVSIAVAGWDRLVSPISYQTGRGLQVESVAATPFVVARLADPQRWRTDYAPSRSYEIFGPGVAAGADVVRVAQVGWLLLAGYLVWRVVRRRRPGTAGRASSSTVLWATIATVGGLVVTSPVFSPQYLLWLLPLVVLTGRGPRSAPRGWVVVFLVTVTMSQVLFPTLYGGLTDHIWATWPATILVVTRNLLFVALVVSAVRHAVASADEVTPAAAGAPLPGLVHDEA